MTRLRESTNLASDKIAIAVCHSGTHLGLLYQDDSGTNPRTVLFHLCSHQILRNSPPLPGDKCAFAVVPAVELEHAHSVIAHTNDIWEKNQDGGLPYGFSDPRGFFDSDGNMVFGPGQVGLTCASMILAIFDISGVPLLQYDTWEVRADDEDVQLSLIRRLRSSHPEHSDHFDLAETQVGTVRFRPLEVAGGAYAENSPISFATAKRLANELQEHIQRASLPTGGA